jgi:SAM-dependent methyltransferase
VRWLDFGAGAGGLVRYVNEHVTGARCVGYDEGAMVAQARQSGIAFLDESDLAAHGNAFDVVTMIEVVEHLPDPVDVLRKVRALLKPGGLLFLTTGNAEPQLRKFAAWPYVSPEIHLSYFTPGNLEIALRRAGFDTRYPGYVRGWTDIVRFKILKNLKVRRRGGVERIAPWPVLSRLADWRFAVSRHPVGFAAARDAHAA